jgi:hypothetical protein
MANRRYFGSIRRRESGRWQIRYRTRDGVPVAWPETYARRADAVRVLAELERQSQVAGNWLDVAASKVLSPLLPMSGSTSTRASVRVLPTSTSCSFAGTSPQHWAKYHSGNSTRRQCVSGAPGCSKPGCLRPCRQVVPPAARDLEHGGHRGRVDHRQPVADQRRRRGTGQANDRC